MAGTTGSTGSTGSAWDVLIAGIRDTLGMAFTAWGISKENKEANKAIFDVVPDKMVVLEKMCDEAFSGKYGYDYKTYVTTYINEIMRARGNGTYRDYTITRFFNEYPQYKPYYELRESDYNRNIDAIVQQYQKTKNIKTAIYIAVAILIFIIVTMFIIKRKNKK
jgi:hypothetical protein